MSDLYNPRLLSWRAASTSAQRAVRLWIATTLTVLCIGLYGYSLFQPRSKVDICILAPDSRCPIIDSLEVLRNGKIDFPNLMAHSNGQQVESALRSVATDAQVRRTRGPLALAERELSQWTSFAKKRSTVVLYVSGILSLGDGELGLCDTSDDALRNGPSLKLFELVRQLRSITCDKIVLIADVIAPEAKSFPIVMEDKWNRVLSQIEKELLDDESTPIAVRLELLSWDSSQKSTPLSTFSSEGLEILNRLLCRGETSQNNSIKNVVRSQTVLSADATQSKNDPDYLYSANWPIEFKSNGSFATQAVSHAWTSQGIAQSNFGNAEASADPVIATPGKEEYRRNQIEESLAICEAIFAKWSEARDLNLTSPLFLTSRLSFSQCFPDAFKTLEELYRQVDTVYQLAPQKIDPAFVRNFAESLKTMPTQKEAMSTLRAQKMAAEITSLFPEFIFEPSNSVITNLTLARIGLLYSETTTTQEKLLAKLWEHLNDPNCTASELKTWLDSLDENMHKFVELDWVHRVLSMSNMKWTHQRDLVIARMLGDRLASDPLTPNHGITLLREGDLLRIEAERTSQDRRDKNWGERLQHFVTESISRYQRGIELVESVRGMRLDTTDSASETHSRSSAHSSYVAIETLSDFNLLRLQEEDEGATRSESFDVSSRARWWARFASKRKDATTKPFDCAIEDHVDLTLSSVDEIPLVVHTNSLEPISVQVKFEATELKVHWNGQALSNEQTITVRPKQGNETRIDFLVRRCKSFGEITPLQFRVGQGQFSARSLLRVESPGLPMVDMLMQSACMTLQEARNDLKAEKTVPVFKDLWLSPNRNNPIDLQLKNNSLETKAISCRLFLNRKTSTEVPMGTLSAQVAQRWLEQSPGLVLVAESVPAMLESGDRKSVLFAPHANQQPLEMTGMDSVLLEIKDSKSECVQYERIQPSVIEPKQYVRPSVVFDADRQQVQLRAGWRDGRWTPLEGCNIQVQLRRLPDLKIVASSQFHLTGLMEDAIQVDRAITTAHCETQRALLCWSVDDWPASFVYELDLKKSGTYEVDPDAFYIQLKSVEDTEYVATDRNALQLEVENFTNEERLSNSREVVEVGLDRNNNRLLDDDVVLQLSSARKIEWQWGGVSPAGWLQFQSRIGWHRVQVPIESDWNRWMNAFATLRRKDGNVFSNAQQFVFDKQAPSIVAVRILSKTPCKLGDDVALLIQVNDHGLSGANLVEATWSTTGELEFSSSSMVVPAIAREQDHWHLAMPTSMLPSGKTMLLLRARDRVGNLSRTRPVSIEILSTDEIAAREAKIRTIIRGKVMFVSQTQKNMSVTLKRNVESKDGQITSSDVAAAKTDDQGQFVLTDIPSGKYELEASGIVRGMRERSSQTIEVDAKLGPIQTILRMDKRP